MNSSYIVRIRWGVVLLVTSSVLWVAYAVLKLVVAPSRTLAEMLQNTSSPYWGTIWSLVIAGTLLAVPGLQSMYLYFLHTSEEGLAWASVVLFNVSYLLSMPVLSFLALATPTVARFHNLGEKGVLEVTATFFQGPGAALLWSFAMCTMLASVLLACAIWRCGSLPKWIAPVIVVASVLGNIPLHEPRAALAGSVLTLAAIARIAWLSRTLKPALASHIVQHEHPEHLALRP